MADQPTHPCGAIADATDADFDEQVLAPGGVAVVYFWASWCMPCKIISPSIAEIAEAYAGRVRIAKVDTDANQQTRERFGISAIPTVVLFRNGQKAKRFVGLTKRNDIAAALDELLAADSNPEGNPS